MKVLLAIITLISIWDYCSAFPRRTYFYTNESTLELVHVLYRHGDRNPDLTSLYPSNPYYAEDNYYPYGYGQLTNEGKMREFEVGTALRQRYNNFLGKVWNMSVLDVRSTDYNRTKMSAELMTAGLWPPTCINIWNSVLHWQPIPYNFEKAVDDKELSPFLGCTTFDALVTEILQTPELSEYVSTRYSETFNILANRTGYEITFLKAFLLYFGFATQEELNLPLEDWVSSVYPEPLHSLVVDYYYISTNTTQIRQVIAGYLIKKIIKDTQNKIEGNSPVGRKMFIYSAHETNIATLLLSLQVYKIVDLPPYGSYVLFEIHKIDGIYGFKLFYQDYTNEDPLGPLLIPGCDEFCPFDKFVTLVADILPNSDEECYGTSKR